MKKFSIVLFLIVLALLAFAAWHVLKPKTYTATAWIQVLSRRPYFIYDETALKDHDRFIQTQFALLRSPLIIEKALESSSIAQLPVIRNQPDRVRWLQKKLKLRQIDKSEMVTVSLSTVDAASSEKLVNAVIDAFFLYYENQAADWNSRLISQLTLELNRQQSLARVLQDEIRAKMEDAAKKGGSAEKSPGFPDAAKALLEEITASDLKLLMVQSELKALQVVFKDGPNIPLGLLAAAVGEDPEMLQYFQSVEKLHDQVESLKQTLPAPDDPKVVGHQQKLQALEKESENLMQRVQEKNILRIQRETALELERKIAEKEIEVRTLEIYLESLRERYRNQIKTDGERVVSVVDVSFQQQQLERVNNVLDLLQSRVVSLQTELHAPDQIQLRKKASLPTSPD